MEGERGEGREKGGEGGREGERERGKRDLCNHSQARINSDRFVDIKEKLWVLDQVNPKP